MTGTGTRVAPALSSDGGERLYSQLHELRSAGPAVRVELPEGVVAWSVTRGDVVRQLATHPHLSRDARGIWPNYRPGAVAWLYTWVDTRSMATSEGQEHKRLRKMIGPVFGPRRLQNLRPSIEATVDGLLQGLAAEDPREPLDIRARFAHEVPTRVMCDFFGVPEDQRPFMLKFLGMALQTGGTPESARRTEQGVKTAMRRLIAAKRADPGDDMTSLLLTEHEGDQLTEDELISTLNLMMGAGTQTTVALLVHAIQELVTHRDQLAAALADPSRWDHVVEETLRLHPPVVHLPLRFATADIDLGEGAVIAAGDAVILGFGAEGRDPAIHDRAEEFDLDRADKTHLAFGHGAHYCLGAPLARLEAAVALPALFTRFPRMALADSEAVPVPHLSFIANDMGGLNVRLDGGGAAG
ncbi:cytochrome P450 family protein [Streptomyces clavuligerus]|nr:cytochrome P450 [Streptomyces clavuligerus]ANW21652.1 cytochrome [Streptomyces clavuligerus]AXU16280.1 cytochrome P450 [Streptomyces clavuligerus]MBY6306439.1 cytochrome P450 [Streptomyces clavuligerus]QCS09059.1 cytochrome P450 [Streptomyces clavuligerus]QPJ91606.1 cytochrome P450 [Streptomyces clavuligerus]